MRSSEGKAPGRLDILGGIADYSGALVIEAPLAIFTHVKVIERKDLIISIKSNELYFQIDLSQENLKRGKILSEQVWKKWNTPKWSLYVIGCLLVLLDEYEFDLTGLDIIIDSKVPIGSGLSSSAALEMASLQSFRTYFNLNISDIELAKIGQKTENIVVGSPCGIMDQVTVQLGKQGHLLPIQCIPLKVYDPIRLPRQVGLFGLDTGVRHDNADGTYANIRIASIMGLHILKQHKAIEQLTHINAFEFKEKLQGFLPQELTGRAFLNQFPDFKSKEFEIAPSTSYKIKAASSLPIFENQRCKEFLELLASKNIDLSKMGRLMTASHRAYQACDISCKEADFIVDLVLEFEGAYGARISGGGSGGSVAILAQEQAVVERIRDEFESKFGFSSAIIEIAHEC